MSKNLKNKSSSHDYPFTAMLLRLWTPPTYIIIINAHYVLIHQCFHNASYIIYLSYILTIGIVTCSIK